MACRVPRKVTVALLATIAAAITLILTFFKSIAKWHHGLEGGHGRDQEGELISALAIKRCASRKS